MEIAAGVFVTCCRSIDGVVEDGVVEDGVTTDEFGAALDSVEGLLGFWDAGLWR